MKYTDELFGLEALKNLLILKDGLVYAHFPNERFKVYIVGGAALMLLATEEKITNDIDILAVSDRKIVPSLMDKTFNDRVQCTSDSFSIECKDRAIKIDIGETLCLDYHTLCLEDIVSSKLYAGRPKDINDLKNPKIKEHINWELLDQIVYEEMKPDSLSERRWKDLVYYYELFKEGEL